MTNKYPTLLCDQSYSELVSNHMKQLPVKGTRGELRIAPVVKLHIPFTYCLWLLSELDPETDIAYGYCQISYGELGYVSLEELADIDMKGMKVVRDPHFRGKDTVSGYADRARGNGGLLTL